jgi:hypothetical protein
MMSSHTPTSHFEDWLCFFLLITRVYKTCTCTAAFCEFMVLALVFWCASYLQNPNLGKASSFAYKGTQGQSFLARRKACDLSFLLWLYPAQTMTSVHKQSWWKSIKASLGVSVYFVEHQKPHKQLPPVHAHCKSFVLAQHTTNHAKPHNTHTKHKFTPHTKDATHVLTSETD